jgi:hypothetical protein
MIDPACSSPTFGAATAMHFSTTLQGVMEAFTRANPLSTAPREVLSALDTVRISPVL